MKRILMLSTGGTIATQETEAGKVPKLSSRALLGAIPELSALCQVEALKLIPGIQAEVLDLLLPKYHALIVEGFGVGGVPYYASADFAGAVGRWIAAGKVVIMTTQVIYEGSDMSVYQVGNQIKKDYGVVEAYDMTLEAVVTKTMYLLPLCRDLSAFRRAFLTPVSWDILLPEEK